MKLLFFCLLLWFPIIISAQNNSDVFRVNYDQYDNNKKTNNEQSIFYHNDIVFLSKPEDKIQHYTDLKNSQNISTIKYENKIFTNVTLFSTLPAASLNTKTKLILGYSCQYASFTYFSNKIEVWYTEKTFAKGSPYNKYLPNNKALVLEIIVNGNRRLMANAITEIKDYLPSNNFNNNAIPVSNAEFEEIKINSRYTKLEIFKNEIINFDPDQIPTQKENLQDNYVYHFSKGTVILKKVKLPPALKKSDYVYAKLSCKSNGDAYDRTGSVFIIPTKKDSMVSILDSYQYGLNNLPIYTDNQGNTYQGIIKEKNYAPPIEVLRFFTSFGADHFNEKRKINNYNWAENIVYKQEISSLIPVDEEEIWIGVFIGNYDSGGHIVSLDFDFYPSFNTEGDGESVKYIESLFSTVNTLEMSGQNYGRLFNNDTLKVNLEITENVKDLQLLYTSTGHGGWGGGDEFNPKLNHLFIDGEEVFKIVPWRTDCASYRLSNPASGNFNNGLSSSDLSRSNWCPATLTPPYIIPLPMLKKGKHVLEVIIDQGDDKGNSFNHWSITGVLIGETTLIGNKTNANKE